MTLFAILVAFAADVSVASFGAVADGSEKCLPAVRSSWEGLECLNYSPLVYAYCATNVALTGRGTIRSTHVRTARRPTRCNASVTAHPMVKDCFHKQNKGCQTLLPINNRITFREFFTR